MLHVARRAELQHPRREFRALSPPRLPLRGAAHVHRESFVTAGALDEFHAERDGVVAGAEHPVVREQYVRGVDYVLDQRVETVREVSHEPATADVQVLLAVALLRPWDEDRIASAAVAGAFGAVLGPNPEEALPYLEE